MKKEYINPAIEIINVETAQMIAESTTFANSVDSNEEGTEYTPLSRGSSVWGDDDDEY